MKLGQIYNLDSLKKLEAQSSLAMFKDSDAGVILARSLTHVDPKIFEKKFPELVFMNSGIVIDNSGGYVQRIQSRRVEEQGGFSNAGDAADNKGKISMLGDQSIIKVIEREAHSKWTDTQVKQAELENRNLVTDYIKAHNKIYMRELDQAGYTGVNGNLGLLNYTGFVSGAATGAIGALTAQQMYDEFATFITDQWNGVANTAEYKANRVDMPVSVLNVLNVTILNSAAGSSTVLKALQDNFAGVEFRGTDRAEDVGGNSATVAYSNNEESLLFRLPLALTIGEIIKIGSFDFQVDSKYRVAGVDFLEDTAGRILTGL